MSTPDDEYRALLEDREGIITDLRAKLQAAEGAKIAVVSDRDELEANYHDCIYERDRLQAEAKQMREEIRTCIYMTDRYNPAKEGTSLMHFAGTYERLADDHARLQAEVARLEKNANPLVQLHEDGTITQLDPVQLRTRIAELEAIIERTNKHEAHRLKVERHNATEDALRWADKHRGVYTSGRADTSDEWVDRGLKALLGNNETNTNNQGEINA